MKDETAIKIIKRYEKSLFTMEKEAIKDGAREDAEHYKMDRLAMMKARCCMENKLEERSYTIS